MAALGLSCVTAPSQERVIADFEGATYGDWKVSGTAFGNAPAHGTLPGQMNVAGFQGSGLVNSFNGGDDATGKLTSPPFKIERKYLQFLIGGGGWENKTCVNLLVDGKVVRTAVGPNIVSGGSEHLQPAQWDVSEFLGKEAVLEIVDDATGTWGHINADNFVQSDQRSAVEIILQNATREIKIEKPYLNFPVKNGAPMKRVTLSVDGQEARGFDIELADGAPDWWAFFDATPFVGKTISVKVNKLAESSTGLSAMDQTTEIKGASDLYRESLRPQFHFTARRGWLNDPNGLVFYEGEYHLFFQHNPYGWNWGNMHWGHAVSRDLVHWKELPEGLYPDEHGTMFSGSAIVDWKNTAGFQTGKEPTLVAMFTAAGKPFTQGLAFSNDRGRTWTKYEKNPVLNHLAAENRDPKVAWFVPENKWVMALYLDHNDYALFESHDLKQWIKLQDFKLPDDSECPNFFEVPLDGDVKNTRWVFFGAGGVYVVGKFDGHQFTPETLPQRLHRGNCWYASQVFSGIPAADGRCILIPWGRLPDGEIFRGMMFNQMMGLPVELTLHSTADGATLEVQPARELASLRQHTHDIQPQPLTSDKNPLAEIHGDTLEIEAEIAVGDAREITFDLRGLAVTYHVASQKISSAGCEATLKSVDGKISLHLFVDRRAVDIYGGHGSVYLPLAGALAPENCSLKLSSVGGSANIVSLKVHELKSAWE